MLRYFHLVIPEVRTAEGKLHLYMAIDRTSKFAFIQLMTEANRVTASASVALSEAVPYKIHTVLTDNDILFTFPPRYADGPTATYMSHMFDMRCERKQDRAPAHQDQASLDQWAGRTDEPETIKEATVKRYHYDSHSQLLRISTTSSMPTIMGGG